MNRKTSGVIAAGHGATAQAGSDMLEQGGNAFDALVAAAFASFVCEPTLTSAGGGGFLAAYHKETGESTVLDFFVNMPGLNKRVAAEDKSFFPVQVDFGTIHQEFHVGASSVAVPGNIAGLFETHQRFGQLPLEAVLSPAVDLAQNGVIINSHQAYFISILAPILTFTNEGREIFSPQGKLLKEGDLLLMKDFAEALQRLSLEGASDFYRGELAAQTVRSLQERNGILSQEDLNQYRVAARKPLSFDYRGYTVLTNPPPSAGGSLIALTLKILEGFSLNPEDALSSRALNAMIAAMQLTNNIRSQGYDEKLHEHSEQISELFAPERISVLQGHLMKMLEGEACCPEFEESVWGSGSTTQISVMDEMGNAASLTASNGEGSGIFIPGTGIMLNNMLGEEDINPSGFHGLDPGRRISSMMSPTIILHDGEPIAVLGSGGSNRIRSAILQAVVNLIDFKQDVRDAVNAPRIHWERGILNLEPGIHTDIAPHLSETDRRIYWKETNLFFGGVHAVTRDHKTGSFSGAGDFRRGGVSISVK